jgi:hypothetical protein
MIKINNTILENYFIDPETAIITDKNGIIQETRIKYGRRYWKKFPVYKYQMHTHVGYIPNMHIHHKDFNKLNDSLSNLEYLSNAEHTKIHHKGKKVTTETKIKLRIINLEKNFHHLNETKKIISEASKNRFWVNNGIINKFVKDNIPEGFVKGRLKSTNTLLSQSKKDKKIFNDGIKNHYFFPEEAPANFVLGKVKK